MANIKYSGAREDMTKTHQIVFPLPRPLKTSVLWEISIIYFAVQETFATRFHPGKSREHNVIGPVNHFKCNSRFRVGGKSGALGGPSLGFLEPQLHRFNIILQSGYNDLVGLNGTSPPSN